MEKYELLEWPTGRGSQGEVLKAKVRTTDEIVAIKRIRVKAGVDLYTIREAGLIQKVEHPNIVRVLDVFLDNDCVHIVMEFINDTLRSIDLHKNKQLAKMLLQQLLEGVEYIHSCRIIHRDLKPKNILVQKNPPRLAIADFGISRSLEDPLTALTPGIGSRKYAAPEVLLSSPDYSYSADIWSVGCIFAGMRFDNNDDTSLFDGYESKEVLESIFRILGTPSTEQMSSWYGTFPPFEITPCVAEGLPDTLDHLEDDEIDLLKKMLRLNPKERITAEEALSHSYFSH